MTQYHNLDDSGDPGLSGAASSSSHFALAMVQLAERAPLPQLARVRQNLHFAPTFEFKYFKAKLKHKDEFFKAIQSISFRVRAVVVDKSDLPRWLAELSGDALVIELIARLTLRSAELDVANDVLIVDAATPQFRQSLRIRLSDECRKLRRVRPFKMIVGADSANEDGLQLADMIAGAVRHEVIGDERGYYSTFANKVADLWKVTAGEK